MLIFYAFSVVPWITLSQKLLFAQQLFIQLFCYILQFFPLTYYSRNYFNTMYTVYVSNKHYWTQTLTDIVITTFFPF